MSRKVKDKMAAVCPYMIFLNFLSFIQETLPNSMTARRTLRHGALPMSQVIDPQHFEESIEDIAIFRHAVRNSEGKWITDATQSFLYDRVEEYEIASSKSTRLKDFGSPLRKRTLWPSG